MDHHQDSELSDRVGLGEVDTHTLSTNTGRVFTNVITARSSRPCKANILSLCVEILHDCNNLCFHFTAKSTARLIKQCSSQTSRKLREKKRVA